MGDKGPVREDHWWERVFNEASSNVNVHESESGKIAMETFDKDGVEITNKSYSMKKLKESNGVLQYGSFLKSATLLANVGKEEEIEGHLSTGDIEIKPFAVMSDEDLFKACNGRTAHKGARHGLNLSGKLQRIAEQERILLERMKDKQNKHEVFREPYTKRRKSDALASLNSSKEETTSDDALPVDPDTDYILKATGKRKKIYNHRDQKLAAKISGICLDETTEEPEKQAGETQGRELTPIRKKKKSKKLEQLLQSISEIEPADISRKRNKKSKRNLEVESEPAETLKKKKKHKRKLNDDCEQPSSTAKVKKVKLDDSYEASEDDVIARLNAETSANYENPSDKKSKTGSKYQRRRNNKRQVEKIASILAEKL